MADVFRWLERVHVRGKAEETDGFKEAMGFAFILDGESALFELRQLRRHINGRLAEGLHAEKLPDIKNPLNLCVAAEATIDMAGVLRGKLCSVAWIFKMFGSVVMSRGDIVRMLVTA